MRIELNNPHGAIRRFVPADLPDFAVLIGRNGAGKTHQLAALKAGDAVVHGTATHEIDFFDMVSFSPADNVEVHGRQTNTFAKATSDAFLLGRLGGRPPVETATEIFDRFADEVERTDGVRKRTNSSGTSRMHLAIHRPLVNSPATVWANGMRTDIPCDGRHQSADEESGPASGQSPQHPTFTTAEQLLRRSLLASHSRNEADAQVTSRTDPRGHRAGGAVRR